jgi:DNA-binding GntR family transcriptional regulator
VYASRILIEALAIRLAVPRIGDDEIGALRRDLELMRSAGDAGDLSSWEPVHRMFHRRLLAGNEAMERIIDPVVDRSERYRRSSLFKSPARTWEIGNDEHEAIVDAVEARTPEHAALLLARHLARSALTVLAKIAPDEDPKSVRAALDVVQRAAN